MPPCAVRVVWCGRIKLHRYASEEGARRAIDAALETGAKRARLTPGRRVRRGGAAVDKGARRAIGCGAGVRREAGAAAPGKATRCARKQHKEYN